VCVLVSLALLGALACGRPRIASVKLPPPEQSTVVGPGDLFEVTVLGEKDLAHEYRVQPDGTIDFPYLDRLEVAGLEPQQIEDLIKRSLIDRKILLTPQVTLVVKQYNSKKVSIIGAVQKPGNLNWSEGMKLIDAVSAAGGLTSMADASHVRITRIAASGKTVSATIDVDDITDGKLADIPLQAGDTIKVDQRVF
jgi:polysaccharide export outer membrane protein